MITNLTFNYWYMKFLYYIYTWHVFGGQRSKIWSYISKDGYDYVKHK